MHKVVEPHNFADVAENLVEHVAVVVAVVVDVEEVDKWLADQVLTAAPYYADSDC